MDFLVRIETSRVSALPAEEYRDLLAREWARGQELHAQGILRTLWRVPGYQGNVGLWSARDADELAEALQSLPIWPLVTAEVTPLATHPLMTRIGQA
ncbi:muconolactone Delta-isomerase family protein [Amycolatopsis ultiminotia]|uniref:Muconolactone Delta-isomerase family protein n=1 Tax=Amycolatopsis ultiminotia TaxID=543629 RepID=A0ABP6XW80_9PSEU